MSDSEDFYSDLNDQLSLDLDRELLRQILESKNGMPSSIPSAFLMDDEFEEPYTLEEIKSDPSKHILWAAEHNNIEDVEMLLLQNKELVNSIDDDLYTPLHRASYNGHIDMIQLLLTNGADINAKTVDGWQPFHSACRWDNVDVAQLLIKNGADVHAVTKGNNTALHLAAAHGEAKNMIEFLLAKTDIDVTIRNGSGDTAEDISRRNSSFEKLFTTARSKTSSTDNKDCHGMTLRVVIIPGNGGGNVHRANWYGWVQKTIQESLKIECQLENMPDPYEAKESVWLPFMKENLKCDERTIAIGHSSGAAAIMRYAESNHLFAAVLVSAYVSDLGDRNEAASGYFNRPWQWDKIKDHCKYIVQFGSSDDPFLPWEEQEEVAKMTGSELHASDSEGHYMKSKFPELIKAVKVIVGKAHIKQLK